MIMPSVRARILASMTESGPGTCADLARRLGCCVGSVYQAMAQLSESHRVECIFTGITRTSRGRVAYVYGLPGSAPNVSDLVAERVMPHERKSPTLVEQALQAQPELATVWTSRGDA